MTISRYARTPIFENDDKGYYEAFRKRYGNNQQVTSLRQYQTLDMSYPKAAEVAQFGMASEFWKSGDRLYKYAEKHYGDAQYWWVIAWFNKKPTDAHFKLGDLVKIPLPINQVLGFYGL